MKIRGLGYVGFGAPDPKQWLKFGVDIIGAMPARALPGESWGMPMDPTSGPASKGSGVGADGSVYLKFDDYQWRIAVHPHPTQRGILYIGFELASPEDLEIAIDELHEGGFEARMGTLEEARARAVTGAGHLGHRRRRGGPIGPRGGAGLPALARDRERGAERPARGPADRLAHRHPSRHRRGGGRRVGAPGGRPRS